MSVVSTKEDPSLRIQRILERGILPAQCRPNDLDREGLAEPVDFQTHNTVIKNYPRTILIHGPSGSGKISSIRKACRNLQDVCCGSSDDLEPLYNMKFVSPMDLLSGNTDWLNKPMMRTEKRYAASARMPRNEPLRTRRNIFIIRSVDTLFPNSSFGWCPADPDPDFSTTCYVGSPQCSLAAFVCALREVNDWYSSAEPSSFERAEPPFVFCTARKESDIHPWISQAVRCVSQYSVPTMLERMTLIQSIAEQSSLATRLSNQAETIEETSDSSATAVEFRSITTKAPSEDSAVHELASKMGGYSTGEVNFVTKLIFEEATSCDNFNSVGSMRDLCNQLSPSLLIGPKHENGDVPKLEKVLWSDVVGQSKAKNALRHLFSTEKLDRSSPSAVISSSKNILLYGPPGTGKSMLAQAAAYEVGASFYFVTVTSILTAAVGESEQKLHEIFCKARGTSPSIIFFDEIEALFPSQERTEEGSTHPLVSLLCLEMDQLHFEQKNVRILAATNTPTRVHASILRSNRIDKHIFVGLPTHGEVEGYLRTVEFPAHENLVTHLLCELSLRHKERSCHDMFPLWNVSLGCTISDVKSLCKVMRLKACERLVSENSSSMSNEVTPNERDVSYTVSIMPHSCSPKELQESMDWDSKGQ